MVRESKIPPPLTPAQAAAGAGASAAAATAGSGQKRKGRARWRGKGKGESAGTAATSSTATIAAIDLTGTALGAEADSGLGESGSSGGGSVGSGGGNAGGSGSGSGNGNRGKKLASWWRQKIAKTRLGGRTPGEGIIDLTGGEEKGRQRVPFKTSDGEKAEGDGDAFACLTEAEERENRRAWLEHRARSNFLVSWLAVAHARARVVWFLAVGWGKGEVLVLVLGCWCCRRQTIDCQTGRSHPFIVRSGLPFMG